ncbi:MAG: ABC transporter substrate-binding protein [Bacteroidetes bacterium]|nr:ABC transporter substrate-binding protein [Bacteroidota bacterium]
MDKVSDTLVFRYNEDQSVSTLDPAFVKSQSELWVCSQIYNSLVDLDSNLQPVPMLASSWEISENGLVYKFHLRTDVQFHRQGKVGFEQSRWVTASDVVYSFRRITDPNTAAACAWIFADKINLASIRFLQKTSSASEPFYAQNDSTFILTLSKPYSAMLSLLGTAWCSVIPHEFGENKNVFGRNPVGTGPFYMKYWEEDVKMVLRKNPDYFETVNGKKLPFLEAVNIDFLKNKQTAFMRFVAGEYDFFNGVEGSFKDELLTKQGQIRQKYRHKFKYIIKPFLNTEYLGIWIDKNNPGSNPQLANPYLRIALNYAIPREELVRNFRNNLGIPGTGSFLPFEFTDNNNAGFNYAPDSARKYLKLAGYPYGRGCNPIKITTTADYLDMIVYIQKYWEDIGIKSEIDIQTGGMIRQLRNNGKLAIWRGSWIADYADAENYLTCFYSGNFSPGGPNYTHFKNADYDLEYEKMLMETDAKRRMERIKKCENILKKEAPVIVLFYDKSIRLYQNNVHHFHNDATNRLILKYVQKSKI